MGGSEERAVASVLVECVTRVPAILLIAWHVGNVFQRYRLPRISGYLVTGVVVGQHVLGLLTNAATSSLGMLDNLCLAVIGVAAGSELILTELRKNPKPALVMTGCITVFTWVFVFVAFVAVGRQVAFLSHLSSSHVVAVASLAATLGVARSPASAIAVLREMDGRGPFCSLVMSVTVVKDVLVVVMFAMNLEFVALSKLDFTGGSGIESGLEIGGDGTYTHGDGVLDAGYAGDKGSALETLLAFMHPIVSVVFSFAIGIAAGLGIGQLLKPWTRPALGRILRPTWILILSALLFYTSRRVGLEPLLVCVVAGAVAANRQHASGDAERETLAAVTHTVMPGINLVFFTLAGTALHLSSVFNSAYIAVVIVVARLFALYCASRVGCTFIGSPPEHRNVAWMGYVTQAGVALGLARTAVQRFPDWGQDFNALMVAVIVLNQLVGPPMFRAAIIAVKENHAGGGGSKVVDTGRGVATKAADTGDGAEV